MSFSETGKVLSSDRLEGADSLVVAGAPWPVSALYEMTGTPVESVTPIQVSWRPGQSVLVRYRVRASTGPLAGEKQVVAIVGDIPKGAIEVEGPTGRAGTWVVPDDPMLPGLRSALHVATVTRLLRSLGSFDDVGRVRLRSYRPGRRGVVEVSAGINTVYLKVVRLSEVEALHQKHRYLAERMPVPDSLGFSRDLGVVVMQALPGTDLRRILRAGSGSYPEATSIAALLEAIPEPPEHIQRQSLSNPLPRLVDFLHRVVPDLSGTLEALGAALETGGSRLVPVHGDFHEAQILMIDSAPAGVIDVDSYGWGDPAQDPATMLGHLNMLAQSVPDPGPVLQLARDLNAIWDRRVDPVELRKRTATVILGLATGPFRVQKPDWPDLTRSRVRIAEQWARSAARLAESRP
jgi:hypothetical protein